MTSAPITETVIEAPRSLSINFRIDCRWGLKRCPIELLSCFRHHLRERRSTQTRHRISPLSWPLKRIPIWLNYAVYVSCISRNSESILNAIVVGLQILVAQWPVLHSGASRYSVRSIPPGGFTDDLKVPRAQSPALRPIMQRRASHSIHHGVP